MVLFKCLSRDSNHHVPAHQATWPPYAPDEEKEPNGLRPFRARDPLALAREKTSSPSAGLRPNGWTFLIISSIFNLWPKKKKSWSKKTSKKTIMNQNKTKKPNSYWRRCRLCQWCAQEVPRQARCDKPPMARMAFFHLVIKFGTFNPIQYYNDILFQALSLIVLKPFLSLKGEHLKLEFFLNLLMNKSKSTESW